MLTRPPSPGGRWGRRQPQTELPEDKPPQRRGRQGQQPVGGLPARAPCRPTGLIWERKPSGHQSFHFMELEF